MLLRSSFHIGAKYGAGVEVGDVLLGECTISHHVEDECEKVKTYVVEDLQQVGQGTRLLHFVMSNVGLMQ